MGTQMNKTKEGPIITVSFKMFHRLHYAKNLECKSPSHLRPELAKVRARNWEQACRDDKRIPEELHNDN